MKIKSHSGFTLVELMVTLAVASIVLTVGIPSFQTIIQDNRLLTQANDLTAALNLARSEAVKRSSNVTVCIRNTAGTACNSGGDWADGWLVFVDSDADSELDDDGDSTLCEDGEECLLRIYDELTGGNSLVFKPSATGSSSALVFDSRGYTANGSFYFCDSRGESSMRVKSLATTGRIRTNDSPSKDCSGA